MILQEMRHRVNWITTTRHEPGLSDWLEEAWTRMSTGGIRIRPTVGGNFLVDGVYFFRKGAPNMDFLTWIWSLFADEDQSTVAILD